MIFLTERSRRFEPVAAPTLAELDALARRRLGVRGIASAKTALRLLMELERARAS